MLMAGASYVRQAEGVIWFTKKARENNIVTFNIKMVFYFRNCMAIFNGPTFYSRTFYLLHRPQIEKL